MRKTTPHPSTRPQQPRYRLWPLLLLPIIGLFCGFLTARISAPHAHHYLIHVVVHTVTGLSVGSFVMALVALVFLSARLGRRQYTLRAVMIGVAAIALMLGLVRACVLP